ncbi:DsbA family oxidoreductase [Virgibacillus sp. W0430]|uniref:DsbA family oxidoreductase n=1 Tax=Virgibacillus sp. W0430 TaxID=3391580 RepID=UPI003F46F543
MKVEIWSDFVCPFCYIGKRRFESALEQFSNKAHVQVEMKSYQLDPTTPNNVEKNIHEIVAGKYGCSVDKAKEMNANIEQQAKEEGLTFHFSTMKPTNTFDAHRLAKYAIAKSKGLEMAERILKAYFTDSKRISNHETLSKLASEVGLNAGDVEQMLQSNDLITAVRQDQKRAKQIGVNGVPFFVFNEKYAISGAQPIHVFKEVLEKVWQEQLDAKEDLIALEESKTETTFCTDGKCQTNE